MRKIFHLSTCKTCQRIIQELNDGAGLELQDIKTEPISGADLDFMKEKAGSYEALFSKRSRKYRALGLHEQELTEADMRRLILEEYTFLKRPVVAVDDQVFVGNAKKSVEGAKEALGIE